MRSMGFVADAAAHGTVLGAENEECWLTQWKGKIYCLGFGSSVVLIVHHKYCPWRCLKNLVFLDIWDSDFQDQEKLRCSHGMFVKLHCTITEPRNSLAQVDRFGYAWRSSWCFWRSRVLIKQCAGMLQIWKHNPKHLRREFLEQFPEFRTVFSRLMRFFLLKCIQFFPGFNVLV